MDVEEAAVEVGNAAEELFQLRRRVLCRRAFVEEAEQEVAVERIELVLAVLLLGSAQPVAEIVVVAVEKALALDEVDEHQPVQHHRGVPFVVAP